MTLPRARLVALVALAVVLGLLLLRLREVLWPLLVALAVAYILDPLVCRLVRLGARRSLAVAFLVTVLGGVLISLLLLLVPAVAVETAAFARKLPQYASTLQARIEPWLEQVRAAHPEAYATVELRAGEFLRERAPGWISPLSAWVAGLFSSAFSLALGVLDLAIIPVLAVYLLLDFPSFLRQTSELVPPHLRPAFLGRVHEIDGIIGQFLRGQLMVCGVLAVLYAGGLVLLGVPLAILIGLAAGLLNLVPYVGFLVGIVAASVLSYVEHRSLGRVALVMALFVLVQVLEGTVIGPRIVGETLGLHPVVVVLALLAAGELLGFVGVLIAVPLAAVLKVFAAELAVRYRGSGFYRGT